MPTRTHQWLSPRGGCAVGLLGVALLCLAAGHFIQLDDVSGFGSDRWDFALVLPAALAATASLVVGATTPPARCALGAVGCLLVVLLVWLSSTDDGFRFIWLAGEGELFLFEVGLGLTSLTLLPTGLQPARPGNTVAGPRHGWMVRAVGYLAAGVALMLVAFSLGAAHFEAVQCRGDGGECDLAVVEGVLWSAGAFVLTLVSVVVLEVRLLVRKRRAA